MKIGDANFKHAVEIITGHCSTVKVSFNVPVFESYNSVYPIVIHAAAPGVIDKLVEAGYSVGICDKGAHIDKF